MPGTFQGLAPFVLELNSQVLYKQGVKIGFTLFIYLLGFPFASFGACDAEVLSTFTYSFRSVSDEESYCLSDYFAALDLPNITMKSSDGKLTNRLQGDLQFFDYLNLNTQSLVDDSELDRFNESQINFVLENFNIDGKSCQLKLFEGTEEITTNNYLREDRTEFISNGPAAPGRAMLMKSENLKHPRWEILCPSIDGSMATHEVGTYFFIYFAIYRDISINPAKTPKLMKFLVSLQESALPNK